VPIPLVIVLEEGATPPPGSVHLGGPSWAVHGDLPALRARPGVRIAEPDVRLPIAPRTWDDPARGGQWYVDDLGMEALWEVSRGEPSVRVAVIDSGIDLTHPDLAPAFVEPYDALDDDDDPAPVCREPGTAACDSHGTSVSGVVLARGNNGAGIVGLCPECTLVPIRLIGEGSGSMLSSTVRAFEHAIATDAAVINNSWGFTEHLTVPRALADVIHRAATEGRGGKGALVVFAAGNDDRELLDDEIEALPDVLCVSATDSYGYPTNYTNHGGPVDISAPSATVTIEPGGGTTTTFGGTSAAAPVVSGLAGWAASQNTALTAQELHDLLLGSAIPSPLVPPTEDGHDPYYGYGEIDALAILEALHPAGASDDAEENATGGCGCAGAAETGAGSRFAPLAALVAIVLSRARRRHP
jgi:serine protease